MRNKYSNKVKVIAFGSVCFVFGSMVTLSSSAYAGSALQNIKAFFNTSTSIVVDGQANQLQSINYKGTTYLPLRTTANLFGANVDYKNGVIYMDQKTTTLSEDNTAGNVNSGEASGQANNPSTETVKEFVPVKNASMKVGEWFDADLASFKVNNIIVEPDTFGRCYYGLNFSLMAKDGYIINDRVDLVAQINFEDGTSSIITQNFTEFADIKDGDTHTFNLFSKKNGVVDGKRAIKDIEFSISWGELYRSKITGKIYP